MSSPLFYRQLQAQLSQWIKPRDKLHLLGFAENIVALLPAESGCLSHWLAYLSHRNCQARSPMARLSYFVYNSPITAVIFYMPILKMLLAAWEGQSISLTLNTSMLWDEYCLIEVCCLWGGRSFLLAQKVMKHGSATVAYSDYLSVLETPLGVIPPNCEVTFLADRGFEHGALIRWLQAQQWSWWIRAKSDLQIHLRERQTCSVAHAPSDRAGLSVA